MLGNEMDHNHIDVFLFHNFPAHHAGVLVIPLLNDVTFTNRPQLLDELTLFFLQVDHHMVSMVELPARLGGTNQTQEALMAHFG